MHGIGQEIGRNRGGMRGQKVAPVPAWVRKYVLWPKRREQRTFPGICQVVELPAVPWAGLPRVQAATQRQSILFHRNESKITLVQLPLHSIRRQSPISGVFGSDG